MKFYGQWNPPVDQVLYENYFKDIKKGFYIDVGANDGLSNNNTRMFEESLGWKGICIEPSYVYSELVKTRPNSLNLKIAISDYDGEGVFHEVISAPGGGTDNHSLKYKKEHLAQLLRWQCKFRDITIPVRKLSTVVEEYNISHIDLLSIDVDGSDLEVIKSLPKNLPDVICIEYPVVELEPIKSILFPLGYKLNFISFNNAFFSFKEIEKPFGETKIYYANWG